MFSIGITGGICSGKSLFAREIQSLTDDALLFDADACVSRYLDADREVAAEIKRHFGDSVLNESGRPDRKKLGRLVFEDKSQRSHLESILHPRVWRAYDENLLAAKKTILLADIPLIYETDSQNRFNIVVVVACSAETQFKRLAEKRGMSRDMAQKVLESQFPTTQKINLADYVIWNDGSLDTLKSQAKIFAQNLSPANGS